jgi:HMG (high mobility group) box
MAYTFTRQGKKIGELFKALSPDERAKYDEMNKKDAERYNKLPTSLRRKPVMIAKKTTRAKRPTTMVTVIAMTLTTAIPSKLWSVFH